MERAKLAERELTSAVVVTTKDNGRGLTPPSGGFARLRCISILCIPVCFVVVQAPGTPSSPPTFASFSTARSTSRGESAEETCTRILASPRGTTGYEKPIT